ncbi:MAG TPA: M1 family metallopeptidase [Pseudoxanthomonas sp.]|nr:M1 family metallopeptidase [Pseudoxanthomonas sp.]
MTVLRRTALACALMLATGLPAAYAAPVPATATASAAAGVSIPKGPLPRTVVPSLVQLELKLDPKQERFSGVTRIEADVTEATRTVWMHGRDLDLKTITAILPSGKRIGLSAESVDVSGVLKLTAAETIPAGKARLEISFEAPFGQLQGAYRVKPDGNDYVITQMEPLGARNTFPGFDEPSFKQPWDITLIVPENDVAVANSAETKTELLGDGWKKVSFARTEALPSYLVAFAVGPWDVPKGPDIPATAIRKTPVTLRGIAAKGQGERMRYTLDNTPVIVTKLEEYFGTPYPFDKLDNVAAPDFWAGAMENAGLIVYRDTLMFPDEKSTPRERQSYWGVSAHELAHQWFGDLVTMKWWDDLWLNEAFATWMGTKITGQLQPGFHADRGLLEGALEAMSEDSLVSTRRVHEPINDFTEIQSAFDGITYQKGGAVLSMFETYIGETQFRDGVRNYLKAHARGNATSGDLIAAVAAQSKDPAAVDAAFKSFIDQPGVPYVKVDVDCDGKTPSLRIEQQRYLPLGSAASASQSWGLPFCVRYQDGQEVRQECSLVNQAKAVVPLTQAKSCPAWVMPNAHGNGYYRFALGGDAGAKLSAAFAKLDEREQRVYADSLEAAFSAGNIDAATYLASVPQLASAEVRQTAAAPMGQLVWMKEKLARNEAEQQAVAAYARKIYGPRLQAIGVDAKPGDSDDTRILRRALIGFLYHTGESPELTRDLVARGRAVLGLKADGSVGSGVLNPEATPRDVRALSVEAAARAGDKAAFDLLEKHLRATQDAQIRNELIYALGSVSDPVLAERARGLVLEKGVLRRNEISSVLYAQVDEPAMRPATRQWVDTHFTALEASLSPAGAGLINLYGAGMCSKADAQTLQAKFAERMQTIEGGPRALKQEAENIGLCADLRDAQRGKGFGNALK